jgi:cysteine synthase A
VARFANILQTIGNTPLVKLNRLTPEGVNVYVKVEAFNPMGSVKDRMARAIIEDAEKSGALKPGQTVIEATSGNTGIGLAMVCAQKGYPLVVTMAESFSVERRKLLRFLGAKVVLTPAAEKGTGMLKKAVELAEKNGWFLCRQFENPANADVHTRTTAQEILADFAGENLDYWVSGFGTGGTLLGVARELKRVRPGTKIIAAEPDNSGLLASGIRQPRRPDGTAEREPSALPPASHAGLGAGLRLASHRVGGGPETHRRDHAGGRVRSAAAGARTRAAGRHFRRHLERRHAGRGADRGAPCAQGHQYRLHAAGHG